jgi:hypothetical protein
MLTMLSYRGTRGTNFVGAARDQPLPRLTICHIHCRNRIAAFAYIQSYDGFIVI